MDLFQMAMDLFQMAMDLFQMVNQPTTDIQRSNYPPTLKNNNHAYVQ